MSLSGRTQATRILHGKINGIPGIPVTDKTLSISGACADAKITGDLLADKQPKGNYVKTVNGVKPNENGNVEIVVDIPEFDTSMIGDLNELNTEAKDNLVTAINEVADESVNYADTVARTFSLNKVVCIGDSFCHGWYDPLATTGGTPYGWAEALRDMAKRYNPDAKFALNYEGGSGFIIQGGDDNNRSENAFPQHIHNLAGWLRDAEGETMQVGDANHGYKTVDVIAPEDVETVIIVGGINDVNKGITVDYTNAVNMAKSDFPNAKIVLAMTPMCSRYFHVEATYIDDNGNPKFDGNPKSKDYFGQLLTQSTDPNVCILTDSHQWLITDDFFYGDGLHPNKDGYKRIAEHLLLASRGLCKHSEHQYSLTYPYETNVGTAEVPLFGYATITYRKVGDSVRFTVDGDVKATFGGQEVLIGSRPPWMSTANFVVLPIADTGVYLKFAYGGVFLVLPEFTEDFRFKGSAMLSLDEL